MPPKPIPWRRRTFPLAAAGTALWWAALPPVDCWPLAWIAPVCWVLLIRYEQLPGRRPYAALWLVGFGFWMAALHWLRLPDPATAFGWVALAFYLGFYLPVFIALGRVAVHRLRIPVVLAAPVVWTGLELARAHLLTGITMGALAHTQYRWIALIQVSDLAGAYAVDFVMMLVAASLARTIPLDDTSGTVPIFPQGKWDCPPPLPKPKRALWPLVPAALVLGATLLYGHARISQVEPAPKTRIALIQGSIDIELKHDPEKRQRIHQHYCDLTEQAVQQFEDLDAIIWPETMFRETLVTFSENAMPPDDWEYTDAQFRRALEEAARQSRSRMADVAVRSGAPLVLGVDTQHYGARGVKRFNSAALVEADGRLAARYDKMHRVVFGEYVPFADKLPWLQRMTPLPFSLDAGTEPMAFELESLRIAPNICYESVLSHVIRRQVNVLARAGREPDALVNLTNDGWFWGSSELDMHLVCGVFRAVECRKPFLAAANTGISAWIDANGKIRLRGPRREPELLLAEVEPDSRESWYLEHGDMPAGICLAACLILAAVGLWHRWQPGTEARADVEEE